MAGFVISSAEPSGSANKVAKALTLSNISKPKLI
jgi:hypothetical protein